MQPMDSDMYVDSRTATTTSDAKKRDKNKRKNRSKKLQRALGSRIPNAAHVLACPLCVGTFNRGGLIDHL
jgi:hypothetical protein